MKGQEHGYPSLILGTGARSLIISLILFSFAIIYKLPSVSLLGGAVILVYSLVIIAYIIAYGVCQNRPTRASMQLASVLFCLSIVLFIASTCLCIGYMLLLSPVESLGNIGLYTMFLIPIFFLLHLCFYVKSKKLRVAFILAAILVLGLFAFWWNSYHADDETIIAYYGIRSMLNGTDPYSHSISGLLFRNYSNYTSMTVTANNSVVGVFDYPALFLLVQVPFYFASGGVVPTKGDFMPLELFCSMLLLLSAYFLMTEKKKNASPEFLAYISLAFLLSEAPSIVVLLMLTLIMFMYLDQGRRYSWLIIGLMISLQQQFWIMALLFIAYSFNSYGMKKGMRDVVGAAAVFLIINGYFIALNPGAYVSSISTTASNLIPNSTSPIGYLIASNYAVPLSSLTCLFAVSILLTVLVSLYLNNKKLIPLLSIIPFLFLGHALIAYYVLPVAAFAFIATSVQKNNDRNLAAELTAKNSLKILPYAAFSILAILLFLIVYVGHSEYTSALDLQAHSQSAALSSPGNITYSSQLSYVPQNGTAVYLLFEVDGRDSYYGFYNFSLMNGTENCSYPCSININRIALGSSGTYSLNAMIPVNSDVPGSIYAVLYNKDYYYQSPPTPYH